MMQILCTCNLNLGPTVKLPPHDHFMGHAPDAEGVWGPVYDADEVGRVSVDWKALARRLMLAE